MKLINALIIAGLSFGSGLGLAQEDMDSADSDSYVEPSAPEDSADESAPTDEGTPPAEDSADTIEDTDF